MMAAAHATRSEQARILSAHGTGLRTSSFALLTEHSQYHPLSSVFCQGLSQVFLGEEEGRGSEERGRGAVGGGSKERGGRREAGGE